MLYLRRAHPFSRPRLTNTASCTILAKGCGREPLRRHWACLLPRGVAHSPLLHSIVPAKWINHATSKETQSALQPLLGLC